MDAQLKDQLRQVCAYAVSSATANLYGEILLGSTATAYCRLEARVRDYELETGVVGRTTHFLVLDSDVATPSLSTQFWLPGDSPSDATAARRPSRVHPCVGEFGELDHWELYL